MCIEPRGKRFGYPVVAQAFRYLTWLALASVLLVGCGSTQVPRSGSRMSSGRARDHTLSVEGLRLITHDLDENGQTDQWCYYYGESDTLVRAERDIDFDGLVDLYEHYDRQGDLIEEEMQLDFDQRIDVVRFYDDETVVRRELTTGFDGRFTMVKYYDATGAVLRVERDSDSDGRIDTWEHFQGGEVVRIGRDRDGDGRPDGIDRVTP